MKPSIHGDAPADGGDRTEPAAGADGVSASADAVAETPDPTTQPRDDAGKFAPKPKKGSLDRLIWERGEAERKTKAAEERAAKLEAELALARQPKIEPRTEPVPEPEKFTFASYDDWLTKHDGGSYEDYIEERAVARLKHDQHAETRERSQREDAETYQKAAASHRMREIAARQTLPDYDAVLSAGTAAMAAAGMAQLPEVFSRAIVTSERSAEIVYDLASHPEVALQLAQEAASLPVTAAPMMRRLLEHRLTAASPGPAVRPKVKTTAQPLIKPVSGQPVTTDADEPGDDEPIEAYIRRTNAQDRKAGRW
jgi:hypothetical protein